MFVMVNFIPFNSLSHWWSYSRSDTWRSRWPTAGLCFAAFVCHAGRKQIKQGFFDADFMHVAKYLLNGGLRLTHTTSRSTFAHNTSVSIPFQNTFIGRNTISFRMSSTSQYGPEWPASRVRETFLDFFKERGHTFGQREIPGTLTCWCWPCDPHSPFIIRRTSVRSYITVCECWNESV